jgi:trehalose-phosphatase
VESWQQSSCLLALSTRYRDGGKLVLLFDCDGTLVPYAEHPSIAELPRRTRDLLEKLSSIPRVAIGIVSSRDLDDLKKLVALPGIYYSGTSGLEFDLCGNRWSHPDSGKLAERIGGIAARLGEEAGKHPGVWLERKRLGLAVHYRKVDPERIETLRTNVALALEPFLPELRIIEAAMAIDIVPRTDWTKGFAVRTIFERAAGSRGGLLYAGDEANDADAFQAARSLGGIAIGIGPHAPSEATLRLRDPEALVDLLSDLLGRLDDAPAPPRA